MPIEMPKGLLFSVDTWTPSSMRKRYHFLTHSHSDHLAGIASHAAFPIYASRLTVSLVLHHFPQLDESLFVAIEVGETVTIEDPDGGFSVTAFDANHCPGAIMFLFEGEFGNILHTGDCRLTPNCLQYMPFKYLSKKGREAVSHLDYLFLDCTFGRCSLNFPSKECAIQQVISCIWKHPNAPIVYLACDLLGQEDILVEVSKVFGSKIYVDKTNNSECYRALQLAAPEILSHDASSHFQVVEGFPRLSERASEKLADARANHQPEPLFIRPSAQWYASNDNLMTQKQKPKLAEAERDEFGVWHVCYSIHSSREELDWALQLLRPQWVISTTPPCRAMELDYVKKHCFKTKITPDDPLWKLLNVRTGKSTSLRPPSTMVSKNDRLSDSLPLKTDSTECSRVSDSLPLKAGRTECNKLKSKDSCISHFQKLDLSSLSKAPPITLFGRARAGLPDHYILEDKKSDFPISNIEISLLPAQNDTVVRETSSLQDNTSPTDEFPLTVHQPSPQEKTTSEPVPSFSEDNSVSSDIQKHDEEVGVKGKTSCIESSKSSTISEPGVAKSEDANFLKDTISYGSSRCYNTSLRRLYSSMNVPVPRPLPSLVKLMDSSKRFKVSDESSYSVLNSEY